MATRIITIHCPFGCASTFHVNHSDILKLGLDVRMEKDRRILCKMGRPINIACSPMDLMRNLNHQTQEVTRPLGDGRTEALAPKPAELQVTPAFQDAKSPSLISLKVGL